jgi:hypothetical protein
MSDLIKVAKGDSAKFFGFATQKQIDASRGKLVPLTDVKASAKPEPTVDESKPVIDDVKTVNTSGAKPNQMRRKPSSK